MLTNLQLVEYALNAWREGWVYWYGTYGLKCTESLYKRKKAQYPAHYTASRASGYRKDIAGGRFAVDCVGLIKGAAWSNAGEREPVYASNGCPDLSADGLFAYCKKKGCENGGIAALPDVPGLLLHKKGHVGVTIGGGYAIEAQGFSSDVVRTRIASRGWTDWARLPFLRYVSGSASEEARELGDRELSKGCAGADVIELQRALKTLGFELGSFGDGKDGVDGEFGLTTQAAVTAFQQRVGLAADGVFGEEEYEALKVALTNGLPDSGALDDDSPPDGSGSETDGDEEETPSDDGGTDRPMLVLATGNVNVRTGPSTSNSVLQVLKKGRTLPYEGESRNGWHRVLVKDQPAWVSGKYAELIEAPAAGQYKGLAIDVSQYQENIDWALTANAIDFAILRGSVGVHADAKIARNVAGCVKNSVPFGVYHYMKGKTVEEAKAEARLLYSLCKDSPALYYVADVESYGGDEPNVRALVSAFVAELKRLGVKKVGLYIARHRFKQYNLDTAEVEFVWIPRYGSNSGVPEKEPAYSCDLHQYASRGKVAGISGNVDVNRVTGKGRSVAWFRGEEA
jgi:GH25 family lysozyme M1 (1,4-beta-N-acetylmuramidase)